jgi:anthranilate synthase component 2/para-aminobenzoate synthetase component 2
MVIADKEKCMYLMIDNFDSFVYNLKAYFEEMGRCVTVKR